MTKQLDSLAAAHQLSEARMMKISNRILAAHSLYAVGMDEKYSLYSYLSYLYPRWQ